MTFRNELMQYRRDYGLGVLIFAAVDIVSAWTFLVVMFVRGL